MHLVLQLVVRLLVVVVLCLGAATFWATIDAYRSVDRATAASAERVSQALEALYWRELLLRGNRTREHLVPVSDWRTIETMKLISPGICVRFEPVGPFEKPLCGQSKGIGASPPWWFAATVQTLFGSHAAVARAISLRSDTAGTVSAMADPDAAISLAWQHIVDNIHVALLMALAIAFFASLAIAHTLACVYAASGKPREARDLLLKGMEQLSIDKPDDSAWYGFGLVAEAYGDAESARDYYAHVEKPKKGVIQASSVYSLSQARIAALK